MGTDDRWFSSADLRQRLKSGFFPLLSLVSFPLYQGSPRPSSLLFWRAPPPSSPTETFWPSSPLCFLSPPSVLPCKIVKEKILLFTFTLYPILSGYYLILTPDVWVLQTSSNPVTPVQCSEMYCVCLFFLCLAESQNMRDPTSPTRGQTWTHALCSGSPAS